MTQGGDVTLLERTNGDYSFFRGGQAGIATFSSTNLLGAVKRLKQEDGLVATHWIPTYGPKSPIPPLILELAKVK